MSSVTKTKSFLFIIGFTCPFPGAGWWRIFNFARHFGEKDYKCCVLSCFSLSTIDSPKVVRNEQVYIYNVLPCIEVNNPFILFLNNILASIASIPSFLFFRPSAVIISVPPPDQLVPIFLLSKIMRRKIIIDYRDEFEDYLIMNTRKWGFFYRFFKKFLTSLYRNAAMVTPVTPAVAEDLKRRGVHNVKVTYDGVDTKIFQPYNKSKMRSEFHLPQDSFVIAYIGNIYKPYRVDVVIRALKQLNEKNPKRKYLLILAGGGDMKSVLDLANNLGISDSVKYFGVIKNPTEIAKILSSADCGIIPYDDNPLWQKTYSTKLFEYCAVGLPVMATVHENSALATAIKANHIGLITPPINSDDLATAIEILNIDKDSRLKMSSSALQFARTYDKDKLARDLLETIESLQ
ncbi:MAG: glycosyltransferase family 4 protein [Candidatus Bathyarchaeia archaeon]